MEKATLGGGCFWCIETAFEYLKGVEKVVSGYAGGHIANPDYHQVCTGETGHAEVVQVTFDPDVIAYETLLDVFFLIHDPTTINRQGNDVGPQYRSIILYHTENQKEIAYDKIREIQSEFTDPVVTEVVPLDKFYPAEDYHQDYYTNHGGNMYCRLVIDPKLQKLFKKYAHKVKSV